MPKSEHIKRANMNWKKCFSAVKGCESHTSQSNLVSNIILLKICVLCIKETLRLTSDFNCEVLSNHAVPGSQVSMDKLVGIEVCHPVRYLSSHLNHLLQRRQRLAARALLHSRTNAAFNTSVSLFHYSNPYVKS